MTQQRAVATLALATIASRILGFVRIIVIAGLLGTTALGNTFQSTNAISNILFDLLAAGALSAAIVPPLVKAYHQSEIELQKLVSSITTLILIFLGFVSIVAIVFAHSIAELLFQNAPITTKEQQIATGTVLLRFFIPQIVLYALGALAVAALTAKKKFIAQVVAPIGGSIFIMIAIALFRMVHNDLSLTMSSGERNLLGIAGTGACVAFVGVPIVIAAKNKIYIYPSRYIASGMSLLKMSLWAIAIQSGAAVILSAALFVGNGLDGAVVAYQLAFVFFLAPYAILSQSFSTVLLPDLSHESQNEKQFASLVKHMMIWTYRPMIIATGMCLAMSRPLTYIVTQANAGSGQELVEIAFVCLVLGILPYSLYQGVSRIYFARGNIRLPALTILISSICVAVIGIGLSRVFEGKTLVIVMGLMHTSAYLIAGIVLIMILRRDKLEVLPDRFSLGLIVLSVVYICVGNLLVELFDINNRFDSILFCVIFTGASGVLVLIGGPKSLKHQLGVFRQQISSTSNNEIEGQSEPTLDIHDIELSP